MEGTRQVEGTEKTRSSLLSVLIAALLLISPLLLSNAEAASATITFTSPPSGTTLYRTEGYVIAGVVSPVTLPDNVLIQVTPPGSGHPLDVQTVVVQPNGSFTYKTNVGDSSGWTSGTYTITATDSYGNTGSTSFVYSTSGAPTSTTVSPGQSSDKGGVPLFFTATVTAKSIGASPSGNVTWSDGGAGGSFSSSTCPLNSVAPATSSCQVKYRAPSGSGSVTVTASYSGDAGHTASSGQVTLTVSGGTTATLHSGSGPEGGNQAPGFCADESVRVSRAPRTPTTPIAPRATKPTR